MLQWAAPRAAACLRCGRNQPGPVSRPPACAKGQRRRAPGCRARRVGSRAEPAGWHAALQRRACGARGPRAGRPAASAAAAAGGARTPADAASGLPIAEVLGDVLRALDDGGALVLQAPPGAGKTSAVPLALLLAAPAWLRGGLILVRRGDPRRRTPPGRPSRGAAVGATHCPLARTLGTLGTSARLRACRPPRTRPPRLHTWVKHRTAAFIQPVSVCCVAAGAPEHGACGCGQPDPNQILPHPPCRWPSPGGWRRARPRCAWPRCWASPWAPAPASAPAPTARPGRPRPSWRSPPACCCAACSACAAPRCLASSVL